MEARGYTFSERAPDQWVNLNAYMQDRTRVTSIPTVGYNYHYSYRARSYVAVPYWRERTDVRQYTEGTLNVDLLDRQRNSLAWEGIAVGRIARMTPEDRAERIQSTLSEIFPSYPYRAGSTTPANAPWANDNGATSPIPLTQTTRTRVAVTDGSTPPVVRFSEACARQRAWNR